VIGIFGDGRVGVVTPSGYRPVLPEHLLVAMGAREKALSFQGSALPGVYGAGAFQTLVNRDGVKAADRLFVLGGGNVGLIGAYHALQAGIDVVGLVEALPQCGGYKVHQDKLKRLGVPVWTRHTVLCADGKERLERVTIARLDDFFAPVRGTEQTFSVDTLLIAVGLSPVNEILLKARQLGFRVSAAGDAAEVAEASAAIFSGRIEGRRIAAQMGWASEIPVRWHQLAETLKQRPGRTEAFVPRNAAGNVYPLIRCVQEIPCNPCAVSCPEGLIEMAPGIMDLPRYKGGCIGCARCVSVCPGLAIVLVNEDYDDTRQFALITVPFEFGDDQMASGGQVTTVDFDGESNGIARIVAVRERPDQDRRRLLQIEVPFALRHQVAGFRLREPEAPESKGYSEVASDPVVCRCERIRRSEIVAEIRAGVSDMNQLKALCRVSMGGCGGKTCGDLVMRIFREEGVSINEVTTGTVRPLIAEMPLGAFIEKKDGHS
jgi:ferredoxin